MIEKVNSIVQIKLKILYILWYIYTMEYYSAIKRNAFESVLMRWMDLDPVRVKSVRKIKINIVY